MGEVDPPVQNAHVGCKTGDMDRGVRQTDVRGTQKDEQTDGQRRDGANRMGEEHSGGNDVAVTLVCLTRARWTSLENCDAARGVEDRKGREERERMKHGTAAAYPAILTLVQQVKRRL